MLFLDKSASKYSSGIATMLVKVVMTIITITEKWKSVAVMMARYRM